MKTSRIENRRLKPPFISPAIELVGSLDPDDVSRFEGEGGLEAPARNEESISVPLENAIWRRPHQAIPQRIQQTDNTRKQR